jgi:hypothetical protein
MTDNQAQMEVRSVKLKRHDKDGKEFTPEILLWNPVQGRNDKADNCKHLCHADFIKAVARLASHLAALSNAVPASDFENSDLIEEFEARGFSLAGRDEELRVTVKGHRKTTYAGAITFNATILLNQDMDSEGSYPYCDDLQVKIKRISAEALLYYYDNKAYEDSQLSLSLPDPAEKVTKAKIAEPAKTMEAAVGAVAESYNKDLQNGTPPVSKPGRGGKKRTAQTAQNKSGIIED